MRRWRAIARRFKREVRRTSGPRSGTTSTCSTRRSSAPGPSAMPTSPLEVFTDRIRNYMEKATKEAKVHTSWVNPYVAYDDAVRGFVTRLLAPASPFIDASRPFREAVARAGAVNSLAQTLLKITAPGIPDFYQGSELWDLSLVDPDNRRPVDFARRQSALDGLAARMAAGVVRLERARDRAPRGVAGRAGEALRDPSRAHAEARPRTPLRRRRLRAARGGGRARRARGGLRPPRRTGRPPSWPCLASARGSRASMGAGRSARRSGARPGSRSATTDLAGTYRDRFTGRRLRTEPRDGVQGVSLGALLEILPVALLEREDAA